MRLSSTRRWLESSAWRPWPEKNSTHENGGAAAGGAGRARPCFLFFLAIILRAGGLRAGGLRCAERPVRAQEIVEEGRRQDAAALQ